MDFPRLASLLESHFVDGYIWSFDYAGYIVSRNLGSLSRRFWVGHGFEAGLPLRQSWECLIDTLQSFVP